MKRLLVFAYGLIAYVLFLATFAYAMGFVGAYLVPKSLDDGVETQLPLAIVVNLGLLGLFAVQHSVMARPGFKRWWTRIVPKSIERSTFVLFTCAVLGLIFWQWRPLADVVWDVQSLAGSIVLWSLHGVGWFIVLLSTFVIDHFDLFGLKQVVLYARGKPYRNPEFKERAFYRFVRHPLMLGFVIAFWATPRMTVGHLLFAAVTTAYILIAIQIEERDLVRFHGESYQSYRRRVPMILPFPRPWAPRQATGTGPAAASD